MKARNVTTVDEYIRSYPRAIASRLRAIRAVIRKAAPHAEESISYGMPAYKLNGPLVYFAAQKNHIGLYALPKATAALKKELAPYKTSKGAVQFQNDEPLPLPLIRKIVMFRVKESTRREKK